MGVKSSIKFLLCLCLCLPASALQSEDDGTIIQFRQNAAFQSPAVLYKPQPIAGPRFDESHLSLFFSCFSIAMIVLAIRGQQRQDYTQFRDPRNSQPQI